MKEIIVTVCSLLFIGVFITLIGTAGGIDTDMIPISEGAGKLTTEILVLILLAVIIGFFTKEKKDVTDVTRL